MSAYAHPVASIYANVYADVHNTCLTYTPAHAWGSQHLSKCMHTLRQICTCTRLCAPMQRCRSFFAMVAIANLSWVLREHRAGCRLPPAMLLSRRNQSPDAVRSRNPSKFTLARDAVAAAVSRKHHSIIRVGAGLILFVYDLQSKRDHGAYPSQKSIFTIFFACFLEANALEEALLGSDTDSFVFLVISKNRPAALFSLQEFGCKIVVFMNLESSGHEVGPSFDYLAHGAAVGYTPGCLCEYRALPQARPPCLHLRVPASVCPPIRHLRMALKNSILCDLILTKRVKRPISILILRSSRISRKKSPEDSLMVGSIPFPTNFWIAIRRHLKSISNATHYVKLGKKRRETEFQTQLLHYFSKSDNKSNHHQQNQWLLTPGVSYCVFDSDACRGVFRSVGGWTFLIRSYPAEPSRFAFMY